MANEENVVSETLKLQADATEFIQAVSEAAKLMKVSFEEAFNRIANNGVQSAAVVAEAYRILGAQGTGVKNLAIDMKMAGKAADDYMAKVRELAVLIGKLSESKGISLGAAAQGISSSPGLPKDYAMLMADALQMATAAKAKWLAETKADINQLSMLQQQKDKEDAAAKKANEKSYVAERTAEIKQLTMLSKAENAAVAADHKAQSRAAYQEDITQIHRVQQEILAISRQNKLSPLQASTLPVITSKYSTAQVTAGLTELEKKGLDVNKVFTQTTGIMTTLATALGFSLAQALQTVIRLLQQAFQNALDFAKGMFRLEVGVRALQRTGMDITFAQMREEIIKLKESFGTFSEKELTLGAVNFGNLISGMGFTREEMFKLMAASTTLAIVNGRNMEDVQRTMALALASGYTEGLQRLGVSINRVTIATKAGQMGYADNYMSLTEVQRAHATYALVLEKVAKYQEDVNAYQNSYVGQIDVAKAKTVDLSVALGGPLVSALGAVSRVWGNLVTEVLLPVIDFYKKLLTLTSSVTVAMGAFIKLQAATGKVGIKDLPKIYKAAFEEMKKIFTNTQMLGDVPIEPQVDEQVQAATEAADAIVTAVDDITQQSKDDIRDIYEKYYESLVDLETDYFQKIADENQQYARELEKLRLEADRRAEERAVEHARRLEDIDRDSARDVEKENRDYANDLEDIDINYRQDVEKAKRKFRQAQIDEEARYQEKLLQLQEDFMFDLEESVRKGDAKAARQAARKYVLDKAQAEREHKNNNKDNKQSLQDELDDLARAREEKRRERAIEFQQRMEDIARQAAIQKADEDIRYAQEKADDAIKYAQDQADAKAKHIQELADLDAWLIAQRQVKKLALDRDLADQIKNTNDKLRDLARKIQTEYKLTAKGLKKMYDLLYAYYGPNGYITMLKKYAASVGSSAPNAATGIAGVGNQIPGYAEGGSFIATSPVRALFGEGGAELVTATPLSKVGRDVGKLFGSVPAGAKIGGGGDSKITVEVLASKDFEVKIVNKTMGQFTEVLSSSRRARNGA
jgi:hypothetical protein